MRQLGRPSVSPARCALIVKSYVEIGALYAWLKQQRRTVVGMELMIEGGGCGPAHQAEITDQVHLVVVTGGVSNLGPGDGVIAVRGSLEAQSVDETGDTSHGLRRHASEFEGPAFELARTGVERGGELADGVCAAILSDEGERPGPVRGLCSVVGGEPFKEEEVEQADAAGERAGFAERGVELRDGSSEEGVGFDGVLGEEVGGYAEEFIKTERLKHDSEGLDCAFGGKLQAPVSDRADDKHGSAGLKAICADDWDAIEAGEVELKKGAEACGDGLLKIVSGDDAALGIITHEGAQCGMRRSGGEIDVYTFHLVLKGNLMGSTLWRSCWTICQVLP